MSSNTIAALHRTPEVTEMSTTSAAAGRAGAKHALRGRPKHIQPMAEVSQPKPRPSTLPAHPGYRQMIRSALLTLNDKRGSSRAAILKHIAQNYGLGEQIGSINAHLCQALRRGIDGGTLKHTKGVGASGSFLLVEPKKAVAMLPKKHHTKVKGKKVVTAMAETAPSNSKSAPHKDSNNKRPTKQLDVKKSTTKKLTIAPRKVMKKTAVVQTPKMMMATRSAAMHKKVHVKKTKSTNKTIKARKLAHQISVPKPKMAT